MVKANKQVKQTLIDHFIQNWRSKIRNSPKALIYRLYKHNLEFESYTVKYFT